MVSMSEKLIRINNSTKNNQELNQAKKDFNNVIWTIWNNDNDL